jgi:two-component system, LytTR family, sensor kinase
LRDRLIRLLEVIRWKVWAVSFGGWFVMSILYTLWYYTMQKAYGNPVELRATLFIALLNDLILAVLSPFVFWGAQRFPIERRNWKSRVPLHFAAGAVYAALHAGIRVLVYPIRNPKGGFYPFGWWLFGEMFAYVFFDDAVGCYWPIVGIAHLVTYYRDNQQRKLRAATLESELVQAQLACLKMQLHPHFLFNSLHAVSALMRKDVRAAEEMLASLSELLRMALDHVADQEVSLRSEVEFARRYLAIEQTRFEDRLTVKFDIDSRTLDALLPNMILQPLVENAVRHAIVPFLRAGIIEVSSLREDDSLIVTVRDDGPGMGGNAPKQFGMGLRNTLSRLRHLYGEAYDLQFLDSPGGGLTLRLRVPFRTADSHHPSAAESLSPP